MIETALETCWRIDPSQARVVVIPNTLELKTLWVSRPLEDEVRAHPHLTRETDFLPMPFLADGSLDQAGCSPRASAAGERSDAQELGIRLRRRRPQSRVAPADQSTRVRSGDQFALGLRLDEPGRGGNEAVSSTVGTSLRAAWRTAAEPSERAISARRLCTDGVL